VWNGDGFVPANRILVEKSSTNLSPYIYCLPQEMSEYRDLLLHFGAWTVCTNSALLGMLYLMCVVYVCTGIFLPIVQLNLVKYTEGTRSINYLITFPII